ncbi:MAG: AmmeMemoRadiSam system protein B [Candidatus Omnitrophica bacterium]|nr:AmmeMemoRadiSam system protein B [Candidatus Omnitrophota bacterium]MDD5027840.1 AmmeMemoRadiSam system protein B [Candidatus Omnitrophota bacterium]MDD5662069.1 AmmeMemoRadiSam system protein B [Candidatus Omnitrophota bacterium]
MGKKSQAYGTSVLILFLLFYAFSYAGSVKEPCVSGAFYPGSSGELSLMIEGFLEKASPEKVDERIFAIIAPHAGYGYSGQVAAFAYKLIKDRPYKTVVILGTSHRYPFSGASIYPEGIFKTPLGEISVDNDFTRKLLNQEAEISFIPQAFKEEHSVEVQLPFLQKTLTGFKIVPVVLGDCSWNTCKKFAALLKDAIGGRKDILVVVSTDMYHGYDYKEAGVTDELTLDALKNMDSEGLYYGLRDGTMQMCGGFGVVTALILAQEFGYNKVKVLEHTDSAQITGNKKKGIWTVGYASCVINALKARPVQIKREKDMLNNVQREKLLAIARNSIETYLKTGKKLEVSQTDPLLNRVMGAFVTLNERGQLRGCIGSLVGSGPLYLTVRDMAVEAATQDPRFNPLSLSGLEDVDIEISVLSPMEKIADPDEIQLGVHGVLVRKGLRSGVFLPQVATETGWSKEEFMSNLCLHKAGLAADAWKDKATEIYTFTAEVFSEKGLKE